jgi:hypothetical protein
VAQALLRYHDEHHWLRAAPGRVGHLFPRLLRQSEYNQRLKDAAPLLEAAVRWLAERTPGSCEPLRLMDATPIGCGQSKTTTQRSNLFGYAGYGYESAHSRWYWGAKLLLITTPDGTVTGFSLANPKLAGEREQTRLGLSSLPTHEPFVTRELFQAASTTGRSRQGSRSDATPSPKAKQLYRLRNYLRCGICGRRTWGHTVRKNIYYRCSPIDGATLTSHGSTPTRRTW